MLEDEVDEEGDVEALVVGWDNYAVFILALIIPVTLHCFEFSIFDFLRENKP